jgi:hypothetical protein
MKFQRNTVILVGVALLLGAGVLIAESQRARTPDTAEVGDRRGAIFPFAETDVTTLTVERDGEILVFQRDDQGTWQMTAPTTALAEPGAIAFLLSRLNTDAPLQTVTMGADQAEEFGLLNPLGTVTVGLQNGTEHALILGGPDFSGSANYAVIDPPTWPPQANGADYTVLVVSRDVANGINRPRAEWLMPVDSLSESAAEPEFEPESEVDAGPTADPDQGEEENLENGEDILTPNPGDLETDNPGDPETNNLGEPDPERPPAEPN